LKLSFVLRPGADLERVLEQNQLLQSENSSLKTSMQSQSIRYEQIIKQLSLEKEAEKARAEVPYDFCCCVATNALLTLFYFFYYCCHLEINRDTLSGCW
jgi:hypothetical protein